MEHNSSHTHTHKKEVAVQRAGAPVTRDKQFLYIRRKATQHPMKKPFQEDNVQSLAH